MHSMHCCFHIRKQVGAHLVFSKEGFNGFISKILSDKSLGRKVCVFFSSPLGQTESFRIFRLSVYIHVALPVNFSEQFEVCFHFKYLRSYEAL